MGCHISRISDDGILEMAILTGKKCTLYLDKGVLVWRGSAILLVDKDSKHLANEVQVL